MGGGWWGRGWKDEEKGSWPRRSWRRSEDPLSGGLEAWRQAGFPVEPIRSDLTGPGGWSGDRRRRSRAQQARFVRHTRIIVTQYGGPLHVVEEECPEPKKGEVRVRVLAAGVSLPDLLMCEGVHPETPRLPFTPGWDLIGMVDRLGDGISGIQPGQIVAALPIHGADAEFVCLPQRELVPVPAGLDAAEAVSLVLNYVTAHQMLHRSAKVKPGQRVLIHGAAGGVGSALLQLGASPGWRCMGPVPREGRRPCRCGLRRHRWHPHLALPQGGPSWRDRGGLWPHWLAAWRAIGFRSSRPSSSLS